MLEDYRNKIDEIDNEIARLLNERMLMSKAIGEEKAKSNTGVVDKNREKNILNRVTKLVNPECRVYTKLIYEMIFETSKAYQRQFICKESPIVSEIKQVLASGVEKFPTSATVACQGVQGAYSNLAAEKLFELSDIIYLKTWEAVFDAVEKGFCEYGILPIENSSAGSVMAVYDLMKKHNCYIVKSCKLRVQHHLLAKNGVKLQDIKEIVSHQQALDQCSELINSLKGVKITVCDNTAMAAKMVAESNRTDIACISSRECANLYNLGIVESNIQNNDNNYTRFICISKKLQIFENSNKISIMVTLPHEKGSLNKTLNKFSALGLNLTKLESRPMPNTDFEFWFYFDFEANIKDEEVQKLIAEFDSGTEQFTFLGSYSEVM